MEDNRHREVDMIHDGNTMPKSRAEHPSCIRLGNAYNDAKFDGGNFGGNVWDVNGLAPTMKTGASASQQCTVEVKKLFDLEEKKMEDIYYNAYNNVVDKRKTIKIRQATKDGFVDCEIPGIADLNYASSKTRRGRVVDGGAVSPTICAENPPSLIELGNPEFYNFIYEIDGELYLIRIRKLIPRECLRLMDVPDDVIDRFEQVESNTNLYKAAGNSIVVNCLVAIFGMMFNGKENLYKGGAL